MRRFDRRLKRAEEVAEREARTERGPAFWAYRQQVIDDMRAGRGGYVQPPERPEELINLIIEERHEKL